MSKLDLRYNGDATICVDVPVWRDDVRIDIGNGSNSIVLYLSPKEASKLRKMLKRSIKETERDTDEY